MLAQNKISFLISPIQSNKSAFSGIFLKLKKDKRLLTESMVMDNDPKLTCLTNSKIYQT